MANSTEMEIKLTMAKKDLPKLLRQPLIRQALVEGSQKDQVLENYYYDTRDFKLSNNQMAYRIRKSGQSYEATVKTREKIWAGFRHGKNIRCLCRKNRLLFPVLHLILI